MELDVASLLAGPRGRRLCLELAMAADEEIRVAVFYLDYDLDPRAGSSRYMMSSFASSGESPPPPPKPTVAELGALISRLDLGRIDDALAQKALLQAVDTARYWQEPDGEDILADIPSITASLAHVAEALVDASSTIWWSRPLQVGQFAVDWRTSEDPAPIPRHPQQTLNAWGRNERAMELRAQKERPRNPRVNWSGDWWSLPLTLVHTFSRVPEGLDLIEDSLGWGQATIIPVSGTGRILEVEVAEDWVTLCRDFPLEVTASRQHDWYRTTGRDGRWVIPDWEQVATRWDAVHLPVAGYLRLAGRALEVDPGQGTASVIGGWNPDATVWLTDRVRETEEPRQHWHRENNWDEWTLFGSA
ncbi:hypothetical protein [Paenarthrobacter sp. NPDC090522]|uniref:hypothetical protein n=1 Tax=Paenarthrobacter sp. NPDC090522 TaxID=3364383 RepID=UPI00380F017F